MESAGADSFPDEAGRKGIGTPATRAGIIEKLVKGGFIERRGEKIKQLLPTDKGRNLIAVLPETLRSPLLTAQWENQLCQVEHGNLASDDFLSSIETMIRDQVDHAQADPQALTLFPTGRRKVASVPAADTLSAKPKRATSVKTANAASVCSRTTSSLLLAVKGWMPQPPSLC